MLEYRPDRPVFQDTRLNMRPYVSYPKAVLTGLRVVLSVAASLWLIKSVDWRSSLEHLQNANQPVMVWSFTVFSLYLVPSSIRWTQLAHFCGFPISFRRAVCGYLAGSFFNSFLPTGRGGDVARAFIAARECGYPAAGLLGTIFVERVVGAAVTLLILLPFSWIAVPSFPVFQTLAWWVSALGLVFILTVLLTRASRLQRVLAAAARRIPQWSAAGQVAEDFGLVLVRSRQNRRLMMSVAALSAFSQATSILSAALLARAIPGFEAPWYSFPVVIPLLFMVVLLPSLGGYGVREAGIVSFFGWFGVRPEAAGAFAVLRLLFSLMLSLAGAAVFLHGSFSGRRSGKFARNASQL